MGTLGISSTSAIGDPYAFALGNITNPGHYHQAAQAQVQIQQSMGTNWLGSSPYLSATTAANTIPWGATGVGLATAAPVINLGTGATVFRSIPVQLLGSDGQLSAFMISEQLVHYVEHLNHMHAVLLGVPTPSARLPGTYMPTPVPTMVENEFSLEELSRASDLMDELCDHQ